MPPTAHTPTLVAHMAVLSGGHRPNSIGAIRECIERGVPRIEIDIHSLEGGDYVVTHDRKLEQETTGRGSVGSANADAVRATHFIDNAHDRPALLTEVSALAANSDMQIQLDLKDWRPLTAARTQGLLDAVAPIRDRVIVSSGQDWNLRSLAATGAVTTGFDPGLYIDSAGEPYYLPRHLGAYNYRDDHPLALNRTVPVAEYLEQRFEQLTLLAPASREWFISYRLVLQMLDDGFDAASWLRARDIDPNIWTLDYDGAQTLAAYDRLAAAGVARVTTNTCLAWEDALSARPASR
ncbi:MAG TPA: glycerophosphodiester phosphodiesterase family protein [Dehalococcoidia bacterium]|nr:glycerophosphodiester phosphodiesterase family protein [Dehalococcoidia bacterium]